MEKNSDIFFMKPRPHKESKIAKYIIDDFRKKPQIKTPHVGPRNKLMHYKKDLNMDINECVKRIMHEFPGTSKDDIIKWWREDKEKEGKAGNIFDISR